MSSFVGFPGAVSQSNDELCAISVLSDGSLTGVTRLFTNNSDKDFVMVAAAIFGNGDGITPIVPPPGGEDILFQDNMGSNIPIASALLVDFDSLPKSWVYNTATPGTAITGRATANGGFIDVIGDNLGAGQFRFVVWGFFV